MRRQRSGNQRLQWTVLGSRRLPVSVSIETRTIAREPSMCSSVCDSAESSRTCLLESPVALVEDVRSAGIRLRRSREQLSADFQVCLPYRGLFVWHVGTDEVV